jgi:hypothetical protein
MFELTTQKEKSMHKLLFALTLSMSCFAFVSPAVAASQMDSVPELETCTLGRIPVNKFAIPTNTVRVINSLKTGVRAIEAKAINTERDLSNAVARVEGVLTALEESLDGVSVTNGQIKIGRAAEIPSFEQPDGRVRAATAINLNPSAIYPSYAYGDFTINLGIDNIVGGTNGSSATKYSTTIGTTARATKMHSYAYGSQISALGANTTVIGYGATATDDRSVVIGHGKRPSTTENGGYDFNFNTEAERVDWLRTYHENVFPGVHLFVKNNPEVYTITAVRSEPTSQGYRYDYVVNSGSEDHLPGRYDWRYGKSHGPGTFNIVTYDTRWKKSPGMKSVYINDDCLQDLVEEVAGGSVVEGAALTADQVKNGITYISNGYEENGAVQIGKDAVGTISDEAVAAVTTKNTKLRNVGVAIGTRAKATGNSETKNQSIAIGYCARAKGSNAIAIGGGARHLDNETDEDGNNAYANGATTVAIGYSAKALSTSAVAIGNKARAEATNAIQLGQGTNTEPNTLKFQDVTIVKDGKLKGFDDTSLDPKQIDITDSASGEDILEIECRPHVINTVESTKNLQAGSEIGLNPTGSRNYEVFIPNTEAMRSGLPMGLMDEIADTSIKVIYRSPKDYIKLPVMITVRQPHAKCVLISAESLDDGHDWTPNVTNLNLTVKDITNPHIESTTNNWLQGYNLQGATSVSFTYPTKLSPLTTTNVVVDVAKSGEIMSHYLYGGVKSSLSVPATGMAFNGTKSWFELVYETQHGTVTKRIDVNVEL